MAGTLTISTLSDGTNSTSSTNCIQGSAKAWVNFNGGLGNTAGVINAAYNVSSITVGSTGYFTLNFTNAFSDANYAVCGSAQYDTSDGSNGRYISPVGTPSSSAVKVSTNYDYNAPQAVYKVEVAVFR